MCDWKKKYVKIDTKNLGRGGNGVVIKVGPKTGDESSPLVLKYFSPSNRLGEEERTIRKERFRKEIQTMAELGQKLEGVIPLDDYSTEGLWYTMPEAVPVMKHLREGEGDVFCVFRDALQLARTLDQIHRRKLSHRDIKPDNILFWNGRYCFADFGLVHEVGTEHRYTGTHERVGAINTIAPEMRRGASKVKDARPADVYSFAKTLWMLIARDDMGFWGQYNSKSYPLKEVNRSLSRYSLQILDELLWESTADDPAQRPTISEFCRRLREFIRNLDSWTGQQQSFWKESVELSMSLEPETVQWRNIDSMIEVLNGIYLKSQQEDERSENNCCHLLFPDLGGDDFCEAFRANEEGCICLKTNLINLVVKPRRLLLERFAHHAEWYYYMLECEELHPVPNVTIIGEYYQELCEQVGTEPLKGAERYAGWYSMKELPSEPLIRYCAAGNFLFVCKMGPYHRLVGYRRAHESMESEDFRRLVSELINDRVQNVHTGEAMLRDLLIKKEQEELQGWVQYAEEWAQKEKIRDRRF